MNIEHFDKRPLWANVDQPDGCDECCWEWERATGSHGYGSVWDGKANVLTHRVAWVLENGPIPDGMTVDHMCRNRLCVRPSHLRLLTREENARQNGHWFKSHCKWGHPFDDENTRIRSNGWRRCLKCAGEYRARRRAELSCGEVAA